MPDILIRDVPEDVLARVDARAAAAGLSRVEYIRRRLAQETPVEPRVTQADLEWLSDTFRDALDEDIMKGAWHRPAG